MGCSSCQRLWMLPRRHPMFAANVRCCTYKAEPGAGTIEVEIDGVTIRVGRGADAKTLMTVLRALKVGA